MKHFRITGMCVPEDNFMVDTSEKITQIMAMIQRKDYFVINRPRQYGKTTTLALLERELNKSGEYLPIKLSFEGIGDAPFKSKEVFGSRFLTYLGDELEMTQNEYSKLFYEKAETTNNFDDLSKALTSILSNIPQKVVLMIDEVDKSSDNEIFIYFLGMLRDKYLKSQENRGYTFHSVILAGLHDVKSLKMKIYSTFPGEPQSQQTEAKYNSPWNIAVDFKVDMSFSATEISTMLTDYVNMTGNNMDIKAVSEKIYFWTNGYPFLVSKLCKMVHEEIQPTREDKNWETSDIDEAVKSLLLETNTLFESISKNLENKPEVSNLIELVLLGKEIPFDVLDPIVNFAYMYGMIERGENNKVKIHNKIYEERITSYYITKYSIKNGNLESKIQDPHIKNNGRLDFERVLLKFQETIREKYSKDDIFKSDEFLEKDLRMLFLVFLKPIINGIGFSFKEVQTGAEKRLDIVVVFKDEKFVVELKIWRGEKAHQQGLKQLKGYMKAEGIKKGYMLIVSKAVEKGFDVVKKNGVLCVYI